MRCWEISLNDKPVGKEACPREENPGEEILEGLRDSLSLASEILSFFNIYLFISSIYLFSQARCYFRYTGSLILVVVCEI